MCALHVSPNTQGQQLMCQMQTGVMLHQSPGSLHFRCNPMPMKKQHLKPFITQVKQFMRTMSFCREPTADQATYWRLAPCKHTLLVKQVTQATAMHSSKCVDMFSLCSTPLLHEACIHHCCMKHVKTPQVRCLLPESMQHT